LLLFDDYLNFHDQLAYFHHIPLKATYQHIGELLSALSACFYSQLESSWECFWEEEEVEISLQLPFTIKIKGFIWFIDLYFLFERENEKYYLLDAPVVNFIKIEYYLVLEFEF
jgi:hypothetical protein